MYGIVHVQEKKTFIHLQMFLWFWNLLCMCREHNVLHIVQFYILMHVLREHKLLYKSFSALNIANTENKTSMQCQLKFVFYWIGC